MYEILQRNKYRVLLFRFIEFLTNRRLSEGTKSNRALPNVAGEYFCISVANVSSIRTGPEGELFLSDHGCECCMYDLNLQSTISIASHSACW